MGYSRDYTHYPGEMEKALDRLNTTQEAIIFSCPSPARAQSIKGQFYAYFRALRFASRDKGIRNPGRVMALLEIANQAFVRAEGAKVVLALKSKTDEMQALREELEK